MKIKSFLLKKSISYFLKKECLIGPGKATLSFLIVFSSALLVSQNETQKWYFGYNAGLDFSTTPPSILTNGALNSFEGGAAISDGQGNLLFYTDGVTVYNKTHLTMANGTGLSGNSSSTQSAIIVKQPGSSDIYYIFTQDGPVSGLAYSEVNMSLAAGMGSVTVKNFTLATPSCEKLTAVRHCNGVDVWIVTHDWNSANFRTHLVTSAGVNTTPVISTIGGIISGLGFQAVGQMKISPNGKKLGLTIHDISSGGAPVEIYDFDAATGSVSNPLTLGTFSSTYGCEFSPDGTKFYCGRLTDSEILQWDLCAGSNNAIVASQITFTTGTDLLGSFQLATDGKIYIARDAKQHLSFINFPNIGGQSNFVEIGPSVGSASSSAGLPNFITSFFKPLPTPFTYSSSCSTFSFYAANSTTMNQGCVASSDPPTAYLWNFGDPTPGAVNFSALANPTHIYSSPGNYTTQLIRYYNCSSDTVRMSLINSSPSMSVTGTFTICNGEKTIYSAGGTNTYSWSTGPQTSTVVLSPSVTTVYSVTGTAANSCVSSKMFTITVNKCTGLNFASEEEDHFKVYPNPTNGDILFIETDQASKFQLINQLGELVFEKSYETGKHEIAMGGFNKGIYFAKFTCPENTKVIRLVKTE